MTTSKPKVRLTYEDYCQLPDDGRRYEVIDGELYVAPAPDIPQQRVSRNTFLLVWPTAGQLGELFYAPCDVIFSDEDVLLQPDLIFVAHDRSEIVTQRALEGAPTLVVEVLSPSTRRRDLDLKRRRYAYYGVLEYWQADPATRTMRVLVLDGDEYSERGVFGVGDELTTPLLPGLRIPVAQVFSGV
jgi:Uma2 family endonuclease